MTVVFSEAMETTRHADADVQPGGGAATLTLASGSWTDSTHYTATYDVADANVDVAGVTIDVSGAQDAAGNAQALHAGERLRDRHAEPDGDGGGGERHAA